MKPIVLKSYDDLKKLYRDRGTLSPDQVVHAFKCVEADGQPPIYYGRKDTDGNILRYVVGYEYSEKRVCRNPDISYGKGINVA